MLFTLFQTASKFSAIFGCFVKDCLLIEQWFFCLLSSSHFLLIRLCYVLSCLPPLKVTNTWSEHPYTWYTVTALWLCVGVGVCVTVCTSKLTFSLIRLCHMFWALASVESYKHMARTPIHTVHSFMVWLRRKQLLQFLRKKQTWKNSWK